MTELITSPRNPRVAAAARLHRARERRAHQLTLLEGPHLVAGAVSAGVELVEVFGLEDDTGAQELASRVGSPWRPVAPPVLERLAGTDHPRGPVAVAVIPPPTPPVRDLLWLEVTDPGNAGTLIRSAAAFALDVVLAPGAVDPWEPKVLRAGAGAHFATRLGSGEPPEPWGTIASVPRGGHPVGELGEVLDPDRRWAILIGSEAHGLDTDRVALTDVTVTIPMPGEAESLNAAVAGSILAHRLAEWRRASSPGGGRR